MSRFRRSLEQSPQYLPSIGLLEVSVGVLRRPSNVQSKLLWIVIYESIWFFTAISYT